MSHDLLQKILLGCLLWGQCRGLPRGGSEEDRLQLLQDLVLALVVHCVERTEKEVLVVAPE